MNLKLGNLELGVMKLGPFWVLSQDGKVETYKVNFWFVIALRKKDKTPKYFNCFSFDIPLWRKKSGLSDETIHAINDTVERLKGRDVGSK